MLNLDYEFWTSPQGKNLYHVFYISFNIDFKYMWHILNLSFSYVMATYMYICRYKYVPIYTFMYIHICTYYRGKHPILYMSHTFKTYINPLCLYFCSFHVVILSFVSPFKNIFPEKYQTQSRAKKKKLCTSILTLCPFQEDMDLLKWHRCIFSKMLCHHTEHLLCNSVCASNGSNVDEKINYATHE